MNEITLLRSIVTAKLETGKPPLSQRLVETNDRIAHEKGADASAIKAPAAKLFATTGNPIAEAHSIINGMSGFLRKDGRGLPSPFQGAVFVRAKHVEDIQREFDNRASRLRVVLNEIRRNYDDLVAEGRQRVAGFAREVEWPTADEFVGAYKFHIHWLSALNPLSSDVLKGVTAEVRARVMAESEASAKQALMNAHAAPVAEVAKFLAESVEQIRHGKRLRQERFEQIADAAANLRDCNWLGLPAITEVVDALRECVVHDAPRMERTERLEMADRIEEAQRKAEDVLSQLGL